MPALINFQFHLIARIDDATQARTVPDDNFPSSLMLMLDLPRRSCSPTSQVILENLCVHVSFPNALKTRLNWSKNVNDERDAPWQVVLGSMDPVLCVILSLGLWLKMNLRENVSAGLSPYVFSFLDNVGLPTGGLKAKEIARTIIVSRYSSSRNLRNLACLVAIVSGSLLLLLMLVGVVCRRMTRTFGAVERKRSSVGCVR